MTPPDDIKKIDSAHMPSIAKSEAQIARDAEHARRNIARRLPGESGKAETETGKGFWSLLGIGKEKK
jgi:hypothetical protein